MNLPDPNLPPLLPVPEAPCPPAGPRPPWGFWSTLGLGLIAMGVMIAAQAAVGIVFGVVLMVRQQVQHGPAMAAAELSSNLASNPLMLALAVFVSVPAVILAVWAMVRLRRGPTLGDYLGLRGFSLRQFLIWGGALVVVLGGGGWLVTWLGDESGSKFILPLLAQGHSIPLLIAALIIGAPLVEEGLFRGFMYRGMSTARWAPLGAILVPNILWALLHVQYRWPTIAMLFSMGLVLGAARHFSRSTVLPFTLHLLSNSASVCIAFAMLQPAAPAP